MMDATMLDDLDAQTAKVLNEPRFQARVAAARDPKQRPEVLALLAQDLVPEVRAAAASNPATPGDVLAALQAAGATPGLRHRGPPLAQTATAAALSALARSAGPWGRVLAAAHPQTEAAALASLLTDPEEAVQLAALDHPSLTVAQAQALLDSPHRAVKVALALWPPSPLALLRALARLPDEAVQLGLSQRLTLPGDIWEALAGTRSSRVQRRLAIHPAAPARCLEALAEAHPSLHPLIAQNPSAPEALLRAWAQTHPEVSVLRGLAQNPATPEAALWALQEAQGREVNAALLDHPALPQGLVIAIAQRERRAPLLRKVLQRPALPAQALEAIAQHPAPEVRAKAAAHPDAPAQMLEALCLDRVTAVRVAAARHPATPPARLALLRRAGASATLASLDPQGADPNLSGDALDALAQEGSWGVLLAAIHPATPAARLRRIVREGSDDARSAVASRAATVPEEAQAEVVQALLKGAGQMTRAALAAQAPSLPGWVWRALCEDSAPLVRSALLRGYPSPPAALLTRLTQDANEEVLAEVATHPDATTSDLEALAQRADISERAQRRVRARVAAHPACPCALREALIQQGIHPKR
jgi:hypothetical protein